MNKKPTKQELIDYVESLVAKCEELTRERDEARQRYCFAMAEHGEEAEARQTANEEGWDCFNDNKNA